MALTPANHEWIESIRVRTALAERRFRDGEYAACRQLIAELRSEGVDTPLARVGLAMLDYIEGRLPEVAANLSHAERMGSAPAPIWELIGRLYLRLRKIADAARALDRAISLAPGLASARHALGIAHLLSGDAAAAEQQFRAAVQLGAQSFEVHYHMGVVLQRQGRMDEAIEAYQAAIASAPVAAGPAHRRLADLFEQCGESALAIHQRSLAQRRDGSARPRAFDVQWLKQGLAS